VTSIVLPTFRGNNVRSWPKHPEGGLAKYLPLREILTTDFRTDVHFAQYSNPEVTRRLCDDILKPEHAEDLARIGGSVRMAVIVFDVDVPGHGDVTEAWRDAEIAKLGKFNAPFVYFTRHGYRIIQLLSEPFAIDSKYSAVRWSAFYLQSVAYLKRVHGIEADPVADWQRLFRAPHATRDEGGRPECLPFIGELQ
jgi:hypothetical protein